MKTPPHSVEWLDAVRTKEGIQSDYRLAELLDTPRAAICQQRSGKNEMNARTAITVARLLGVPELMVLGAVMYHSDRERNREFWLSVWEEAGGRRYSGPPPHGRPFPPDAEPASGPRKAAARPPATGQG
ncbi:hypothetical protein D3C78_449830 [compost metagenome]